MSNRLTDQSESPENKLPPFEADLKSVAFLDLNEDSINALLEPELRVLKSLKDLKNIVSIESGSDNRHVIYAGQLKNTGLENLAEVLSGIASSTDSSGFSGIKLRVDDEKIQKKTIFAFDIGAISLNGDKILLSIDAGKDKKSYLLEGSLDEYRKEGISALKKTNNKLTMRNYIYLKNKFSPSIDFEGFTLNQIGGETLRISKEGSIANTISGIGFDTLPKEKDVVKGKVVLNFKPDYAEFFSLKEESKDTVKSIKAEVYSHLGMNTLDYSKYGNCVKASLDPNKNFMVGIFEQGGERTCKVIRLNKEAELMSSTADINDFLGFDNAFDIILKDAEGNIRLLDTNFGDYSRYSQESIRVKNDKAVEEKHLGEITGLCESHKEIFQSAIFTILAGKALEKNPLINKVLAKKILNSISNGDLITAQEQEIFSHILDPENSVLVKAGNELILSLKINAPGHMIAPVIPLLTENGRPDTAKVIIALRKEVEAYPHVLDVESIVRTGKFSLVTEKDGSMSLYLPTSDGAEELISQADDITIIGSAKDRIDVEFRKGTFKTTSRYLSDGRSENKIVMSDSYQNQPTFDDHGVGIVQSKETKKFGLASSGGDTVTEVVDMDYDTIKFHPGTNWYTLSTGDKQFFYDSRSTTLIEQSYDSSGFTEELETKVLLDWKKGSVDIYSHVGDELQKNSYSGEFSSSDTSTGFFIIKDENDLRTFVKIDNEGLVHEITGIKSILRRYVNKHLLGISKDGKLVYIKYSKGKVETPVNEDIIKQDNTQIRTKNDAGKVGYYQLTTSGVIVLDDHEITSKLTPKNNAEIVKTFVGVLKQVEGGLYLSEFEDLSVPISLGKNNRHRLKNNAGVYQVGYFENDTWKASALISSDQEPQFTDAGVVVDNEVYSERDGDLEIIKHEYDTVEFTGDYCLVSKNGVYGICSLEADRFQEIIPPTYQEKPEMRDNFIIVPHGEVYDLLILNEGTISSTYTVAHEPHLDYMKYGYVKFDAKDEGVALVALNDLSQETRLSTFDFYKQIEEKFDDNGQCYFVLEKKNGGNDFIIEGQKMRSEPDIDFTFVTEVISLDSEQYLVIGKNNTGVGIYFCHDSELHKIPVQQGFSTYKIEYRGLSEEKDGSKRNKIIMMLRNWDEEERYPIIIKDEPDNPYVSFSVRSTSKALKKDGFMIDKNGSMTHKKNKVMSLLTESGMEGEFTVIKSLGK